MFAGKKSLLIIIGILLPFAIAAWAQQLDRAEIRVLPAKPTAKDEISARLSGTWHDGCVPRGAKVSITKQLVRIQLQFAPAGVSCIETLTPWSITASIGRLPRGNFQIEVVRDAASSTVTMGRKSFRVP